MQDEMPNSPDPNTASTSFTLPKALAAALESRAKNEMTNKSDIVRRALMNYLTTEERALVLREIKANSSQDASDATHLVDDFEMENQSKQKSRADVPNGQKAVPSAVSYRKTKKKHDVRERPRLEPASVGNQK